MIDNINEVTLKRMIATKEIEKDKFIVFKSYNKKVKAKSFQVRDLICKWSPSYRKSLTKLQSNFW
jgi:hypothetical protein